MIRKAGFGGGCHWCTEAVFASLTGVQSVEQGWIASTGDNVGFSEGVVVVYDDSVITFDILIAIHLHTHSSTAQHSMRDRYRSAIYIFEDGDSLMAQAAIVALQPEFEETLVTQVLPFEAFKASRKELHNYYFSNPEKPFCELYITPKLKRIMQQFSAVADLDKLKHLGS